MDHLIITSNFYKTVKGYLFHVISTSVYNEDGEEKFSDEIQEELGEKKFAEKLSEAIVSANGNFRYHNFDSGEIWEFRFNGYK